MGNTFCNQHDCPSLTLTRKIFVVPSGNVITHVLVIHQCVNTCTITQQPCKKGSKLAMRNLLLIMTYTV